MIKRDIKAILPESYNLNGASWYDIIQKDYDRYAYQVLLVSYLIALTIPLSSLIMELYHGRTSLLLNYIIPSIVLICMVIYLVVFKKIDIMRRVAVFTAFAGFFLSIFLPGSHYAYILIFFNFIPIVFALSGLAGGVRWIILFLVSIIAITLFYYSGTFHHFPLYIETDIAPVSCITIIIMLAIVYSGQKQHENVTKKLIMGIVYDCSTKFPNKDSFLRCMNRNKDSIIAIMQITNFKNLSIIFGYEFSDSIMISISNDLRNIAKKYGFMVYKLSWHEFGLQIPVKDEMSVKMAENFLYRIIDELREKKICRDSMEVNVALCIGGVFIRDGLYDNALSKADNALSSALSLHKSVTMHTTDMNVKVETLLLLNRYAVLYNNIMNSTLKTFLQPIVSTETGNICWHEALLRVRGKDGRYESIYNYLSIAKDTGLYTALSEFILDQAEILMSKTGLPVSVNICQMDIINSSVLRKLEQIAAGKNYIKGNLILEIIESEELDNIDLCLEFIKKVKSAGIRVAIDDFGAGYSNLTNLLRLSLDIVKIDGELIRRMESDKEAYMLINGISNFSKNAGYQVVAEYVENETLYSMLKTIGIEYCQGYLFGEPFDPDNLPVYADILTESTHI